MGGNLMQVSYRSDQGHNYMVISGISTEASENQYGYRILAQNLAPEFLNVQIRRLDGQSELCYDITSRQALSLLYETREIGSEALEKFLYGLKRALDQANRFLLDESDLLLDPNLVFVDPDTGQPFFCLLPGNKEEDGPGVLAGFILKHLDHSDNAGMNLGYQLYAVISRKNSSLQNSLESCLGQNRGAEESNKEYTYSASHGSSDPVNVRRSGNCFGSAYDCPTYDNSGLEECPGTVDLCRSGAYPGTVDLRRSDAYPGTVDLRELSADPEPVDLRRVRASKNPRNGREQEWPEEAGRSGMLRSGTGKNAAGTSWKKQPGGYDVRADGAYAPALGGSRKPSGALKTGKKSKRRFWLILAGISLLLSALYAFLLFWFRLDLTQAGGLGFLMLALVWLAVRILQGKKEPHKNIWMMGDEQPDEDEDELLDSLLAEAYDLSGPENGDELFRFTMKETGREPGQRELRKEPESPGHTRILTEDTKREGICLVREDGSEKIGITGRSVLVGSRKEQVDLWLNCDTVSRFHAKIDGEGENLLVTDLNSTNGTFVNGKRLEPYE